MSGSLYYSLAADLGLIPPLDSYHGIATVAPQAPPVGFRPYDIQLTATTQHEVEPSVISTTVNGQVYTATTYARSDAHFTLWYSRRTEGNSGTLVGGQMPTLAAYQSYGDPFLDANIYGGGVTPGRIYNTGIMHNGQRVANNAIGCWHSDDGGATWSTPTIVASNPLSSVFLDKPAVVVSKATNSLGWVYIIYSREVITVPYSFQLCVARSTDGGVTFGTSHLVDSRRDGGHQILVAPNTGYVLALWIDFDAEQIKMSQSPDFGVTWQTPEVAASATYFFYEGYLQGNIRALSTLMARFNVPNNRVTMVWHESDGAGGTDCYYTSKTATGWQAKVRVNDVTTNDQFMPSLAWDSSGNNGLVAYYDRRDDPMNDKFKLYVSNIDINGSLQKASYTVSLFSSSADNYPQSFIGDYHQTWSWAFPNGEKWVSGFVGNPDIGGGLFGDIWLAYAF
jgi:hypothetical protein